jgi:hypothetical protein
VLGRRVRRIAVALDSSWAERRNKEAVQQRRVERGSGLGLKTVRKSSFSVGG